MVELKLRSVRYIPNNYKKHEVKVLCRTCDLIQTRYFEELDKKTISCINCGTREVIDLTFNESMIDAEAVELEQILQDNFNVDDKPVVHKASYNGITDQYSVSTYKALFNMETFKFIEKVYGYKLIMFNMQSSALWFKKEVKK